MFGSTTRGVGMWRFEHSERTSAAPERVWQQYADPVSWPEWDLDVEQMTVDAPMAVGVRGRLTPKSGPATSLVFTRVEPGRGFTNASRLPLARLEVDHRISADGAGSRITHTVTITGPLSPLFGRLIGRPIARGLPRSMRELARITEQ
jgi:hypothetical protein